MKHLRLLLALFTLMIWGASASAQEDITQQYLTNADLSTINFGWTYYSEAYHYQDWKTDGGVPVVEFYAGWGALEHTDFAFSQTITLPAGDYRIAVNAFYREGNGGDGTNADKAWIFAGEKKQNVYALSSMNEVTAYSGSANIYQAANAFADGKFENAFDFSLEEETSITLGFQGKFTTPYSWCILGPVKLYKYSLDDYLADYDAKYDEAEAITGEPMNAEVHAALTAAMVDRSTFSNSSEISAAIQTLTTAINNANASVGYYEAIKAVIDANAAKIVDFDEAGTSAYNSAAAQAIAAYNNGTATNGANEIAALNDAYNTGFFAIEQPIDGFDMTPYITNADFNTGSYEPWTRETPYGGNCQIQGGSRMEYWAGNTSDRTKASFNIYQELQNLPVGVYTVSADMYNSLNSEGGDYTVFSPTCGIYGKSGNEEVALVTVEGEILNTYTTGNVFVPFGNMTVGAKNTVTPIAARWFLFDNVKLTYVRQMTAEEIASYIVPTSIQLSETSLSLYTGDLATITATVLPENASDKTINWTSSDVNVVTVDNGHLIAIGPGEATITATATAGDNVTATVNITVQNDVTVIQDGYYFLRDAQGRYIGRSSSYNTRANMEAFGLPVYVETNTAGITTFKFVDSNLYLFDAGSGTVYTDNTNNRNWKVKETAGGYYIINKNNNGSYDKKLGTDGGTWMQSNDNGLVWTFEPAAEHNSHMEVLKDQQAVTAATAAGIEDITNKSSLETELTSNYLEEPVEIAEVAWAERYQVSAGDEWAGNGIKYYENSISGLKPGLYKLTVKAFYRLTWNAIVDAAAGARGNVYLYGNNTKTQLYSVFDFPADEPWVSGNDYQDANGKFYPNNPNGSKAALSAGNYVNELFVYVNADEGAETGTLNYGIHQPSRFGGNGQWCSYQDFTLTYYAKAEKITIKEGFKGTTYSSEYPLDFSVAEGLTAYIITGVENGRCTATEVTTVPAMTGVYVEGEPGDYIVKVYGGSDFSSTGGNLLVGTGANKSERLNSSESVTYYMYGKIEQDGKDSFYKVSTDPDKGRQASAHKAYLAIPGAQNAKALIIVRPNEDVVSDDGGFADGINNIEQADNNAKIYNLNGQRVNNAQKGIYIKNGKKVIIK